MPTCGVFILSIKKNIFTIEISKEVETLGNSLALEGESQDRMCPS
jgi:DNA-directed RNA polymerase subunit L